MEGVVGFVGSINVRRNSIGRRRVCRGVSGSGATSSGGVGHGDRGAGGGGGESGGSGGGGGNSGDGATVAGVLALYGKTASSLTPELQGLTGEQLQAYFEATKSGLPAYFARIWPAWRGKMAADPKFAFKLLMEETVGLGLAITGMVAARGKEILNELDFAFCDMIVGAVLNFTALWIAAPTILSNAKAPKGLAKWISSLPPSFFSASPPEAKYSLASRFMGYVVTSIKFAGVGLTAGCIGTLIYMLLAMRNKSKKVPSLVDNSIGWAGFMFLSASPRYQVVAGLERGMFRIAPEAVAKLSSGVFRTANNIVGGASWVWYARRIGLQ